MFAPVFEVHADAVRGLLIGVGLVTALVGALMSLVQRHLKRLLAFSTVTYAGLFLVGFGTLDARGLAGAALFVLSHAFLKGALFMCAGVLLHRWGTVDIPSLGGLGRAEKLTGVLIVVAGAGLVGIPPFGTFVGKAMIEEAAAHVHYGWVVVVFVLASGLSSAAGLWAAARIFLGWDPPDTVATGDVHTHFETGAERSRTPRVMLVPIVVLVALGWFIALTPGLAHGAERAAAHFVDSSSYAQRVIAGTPLPEPIVPTFEVSAGAVVAAVATMLVSVGVTLLLLERRRIPRGSQVAHALGTAMNPLRSLHSGHIGDYIAWLTVGVATFGGILVALTR
jgi:multicomponent Na+:H+ antiporter subunit D